jgi:cell wall-associated NlpC family hydrolase
VQRVRHLHLPHLHVPRHHPVRHVRSQGGAVNGMVVGTAAVAPVMASASVRAEQVTQLLIGELADILEGGGEWHHVRTELDGYEGWINAGYVRRLTTPEAEEWRRAAAAWSDGARVSVGSDVVALPLRARVVLEEGLVTLPDGRAGRVVEGRVSTAETAAAEARRTAPHRWALEHFRGAPYQWGGITPWGVDCSGLVQTTYAARGVVLPRDSSKQAGAGEAIPLDVIEPGDLLFFHGEHGSHITHVAFAAEHDSLIHSTIACGGVVEEPFTPGSRAGDALRPRLVAARRIATRTGAP